MDNQKTSLRVLMVPWLAHGHLSPFLELSKKLVNQNIIIYYCSTPINLNTIEKKLGKYANSIELVKVHLPSFPDLPPHQHTTNGLPPHLMPTLQKAFSFSKPNLSNIMVNVKPDIVISDVSVPWLEALALSLDIPCIPFTISGAAGLSYLLHLFVNPPGVEYPHPAIFLREYEKPMFLEIVSQNSSSSITYESDDVQSPLRESCKVLLFKSFEEIEGKYYNTLANLCNRRVISVGPLVEDVADDNENEHLGIMEWLNKKDPCSTVFVCFGSEYFLPNEDMEEMAHGLELSNVNFIWAVRFPFGEKIKLEDAMPKGFQERVGNRGMIVEGWAPQAKILKHSSVGAFATHCGWGSVLESLKSGVAIIAIPMNLDQPINARLVEEIGVGVEVSRESTYGTLRREEVAKVIREVVVEDKGENVRKKTMELSECIKNRGEEEMDVVVEALFQICGKNSGKAK